MKCPICIDKDLLMTERQGIEIDYCPNCRGVWLDRGELDKIIDKSTSDAESNFKLNRDENDKKYENHYENERNIYKKKKSVWGELFDF